MIKVQINFIPDSIGPFRRYEGINSTMEYGFYYDALLRLPFDTRKRHVRVWLPGTYDFSSPKKHPVLYMSDGQNLVDKELTAYGDWHLDRVIRDLMKEGLPEPILVGIDCPRDPDQRGNELNPPYLPKRKVRKLRLDHPFGDKFVNYVADELKPLIDGLFSTDPRKETTAIGGSSMGGAMAFTAFLFRGDVFGTALSFSPPFFFYHKRELRRILKINNPNPQTNPRLFLYVGGTGTEREFVKKTFYMAKLLKRYGFGEGNLELVYDPTQIHHEEAWSTYSYPALRFWLKEAS